MAKMAANSNPNQSFSSSFFPFIDNNETLILQRQKKKPRLASWGSGWSGEKIFKELGDLRYNSNQPLAFSNSPFFHEQETLISQKKQKKPTLASWWWSVDESFNELGAIFNKPPPISSHSTAGVLKPPPEVRVIDDDENDEETLESSLTFNNSPPISSPSSSAVSKSLPGVIYIIN